MSVFRKISALAVVCLASFSAAQLPDQLAAERILGPHWRQMARVSGMIFSGTVLGVESHPVGKGTPLPLVLVKLRVDRGMVGVRWGEVLTVREWSGAWSMQRAMTPGERVLLFLYPPSRMGLTSPVGGRVGQLPLNSRGEIVTARIPETFRVWKAASATEAKVVPGAFAARLKPCPSPSTSQTRSLTKLSPAGDPPPSAHCADPIQNQTTDQTLLRQPITLAQLERAIRYARRNPSTGTAGAGKD